MKFLRNIPINRKVITVTLLVAAIGMILTGGALFGFQVYSFRSHFPRELAADGSIIASHSAGPLALKDPNAAREMLGALTAKPHISEAQLRLPDGTLFARNGRDPKWTPRTGNGLQRHGPFLVYSEELSLDGERIGTLFLRADYRAELSTLLRVHAVVLGVVLTLAIALTALLSTRLQSVISEPILSLASTAKNIAARKDFSVRARKLEEDEIGQFTDAFNEMLAEIQDRDSALHSSRQKLETLINTIEGVVWEADPNTLQFMFVSAQSQRLFGLPAAAWLANGEFWTERLHEDDRERVTSELRESIAAQKTCVHEFRVCIPGREILWVRSCANVITDRDAAVLLRGVFLDVTAQKKAAEELAVLHAELLQTSRQAGMAEVATGVLHNVGNVLNSVNVSVTIACDRIRKSEVATLHRLSALLQEQEGDMEHFLTRDSRGKAVPQFIHQLSRRVSNEHEATLRELDLLAKNIEHIKEIVAMQQNYARVAGVIESLAPAELLEDALQINQTGFQRHGVDIVRNYEQVPRVAVDRHKVLQILINLLRNAKYAFDEASGTERQVTIGVHKNGHDTVQITVRDTGIGIPAENLTRIFSHGFTTRKEGHGFGLHSGANAAKEMGGRLFAHSNGLNTGATFTLELPIANGADK